MKTQIEIDEREKDIQIVCKAITEMSIHSTGDYGSGGECPFCLINCRWDAAGVSDINHEPDCIYLIAKDLLTK